MQVGELVCSLWDWDRVGIVLEITTNKYNKPCGAVVMWTGGATEEWCIKDLQVL